MLNAIHEGILAIDSKHLITMINESALKILNINTDPEEIIGQNIMKVFPSTKLLDVMETGENQYNQEDLINQTQVVANRVIIKTGTGQQVQLLHSRIKQCLPFWQRKLPE